MGVTCGNERVEKIYEGTICKNVIIAKMGLVSDSYLDNFIKIQPNNIKIELHKATHRMRIYDSNMIMQAIYRFYYRKGVENSQRTPAV